jgi:hypothetical protein
VFVRTDAPMGAIQADIEQANLDPSRSSDQNRRGDPRQRQTVPPTHFELTLLVERFFDNSKLIQRHCHAFVRVSGLIAS